jgi:hypothetical protein
MSQTFSGNHKTYNGYNNCTFYCNHSTIVTNGSTIYGNHNRISGDGNNGFGNHNTVFGSRNNWNGNHNSISMGNYSDDNNDGGSSFVVGKNDGNVFNFTMDRGNVTSFVNSVVSGSARMFSSGSVYNIIDNRVCDKNGNEVKPALTIARKYLPLYFDGKRGESFSIELAAYGKVRVGMKTDGATFNSTMGGGLSMQGPFVYEQKGTDVLCYIDESNKAFENASLALATKISLEKQKPVVSDSNSSDRCTRKRPSDNDAPNPSSDNNNDNDEEDKSKRRAASIIIPDESDIKVDKEGADDEFTCVVCMNNIPQAISSCGHFHYCITCAIKLGKDKTVGQVECVTCRKQVTSFIRVFSQ